MKSLFTALLLLAFSQNIYAQSIPYGNNEKNGNYFDAGNKTRLYYETYGEGEPVILLHGGVFGYIDELESFISRLSKEYTVYCLATRGHGKSEIGHEPFTYKQMADDVYKLIRHLKLDSVILLGFSDGALSALKTAAIHPEAVKKVIAIGVGEIPKGAWKDKYHYSADDLLSRYRSIFSNRLKFMPEPERWDESLQMLNQLYNNDYMSDETFIKIQCPVLLLNGEDDEYFPIDTVINCYKKIPNADLSIIPGCSHVVFFCNFPAVWEPVKVFLGMRQK